jgi:hypothetical protein
MKSIHRRTLLAIFSDPMARSLQWRQIEMLFLAIGAQLVEDADRACASCSVTPWGHFTVHIRPRMQSLTRSEMPVPSCATQDSTRRKE